MPVQEEIRTEVLAIPRKIVELQREALTKMQEAQDTDDEVALFRQEIREQMLVEQESGDERYSRGGALGSEAKRDIAVKTLVEERFGPHPTRQLRQDVDRVIAQVATLRLTCKLLTALIATGDDLHGVQDLISDINLA